MEQLLRISSVPISVEITVNRARLQYNNQLPKVQVTRERGGFQMEAEPIRMNMDSTKMRDSIGLKSPDTLMRDCKSESMKITYQAIASMVQDGNRLMETNSYTPARLAAARNMKSIETVLEFLPKEGPEISWSGGTLSVKYETDKLNFNWDLHPKQAFEFVPGNIEFQVKDYPKVNIEYVGEPIYVPASANPDYAGPILDAKA